MVAVKSLVEKKKFKYGSKVRIITDGQNNMHVVTAIVYRGSRDNPQYEITCNNIISYQYGCMLSLWQKKDGNRQAGFIQDFE